MIKLLAVAVFGLLNSLYSNKYPLNVKRFYTNPRTSLIENVNSVCVWNLRIQIQMWNSFVQRMGIMFFKEGVGETH